MLRHISRLLVFIHWLPRRFAGQFGNYCIQFLDVYGLGQSLESSKMKKIQCKDELNKDEFSGTA